MPLRGGAHPSLIGGRWWCSPKPTTAAIRWPEAPKPAPWHRPWARPTSRCVPAKLERHRRWVVRSSNYALYRRHEAAADATLEPWVRKLEGSIRSTRPSAACTGGSVAISAPGAWALRPAGAAPLGLPVGGGHCPLQGARQAGNKLAKQDPCHGGRVPISGSRGRSDPWAGRRGESKTSGHSAASSRAGGRLARRGPMRCSCASWPAVSCGPRPVVVGFCACSRNGAAAAACRWWRCRPPSRKPGVSPQAFSDRSATGPSLP